MIGSHYQFLITCTLLVHLYCIIFFRALQILSDPRVRLEMRLREAGLEIGDYARSQLAHLQLEPPPQLAQSKAFPF